ncbi:MAG: hypothetical protein HC936_03280 [Leptolyngbyaceae cyanobacterium SU_3_3]|nr:hypothetical protein [Leptolyngbyaceae cyanobacterium SU_3_3]NJR51689.1 hypothetical protein [Leptolyngbyaceae cyanobacterium CSU_1_3]
MDETSVAAAASVYFRRGISCDRSNYDRRAGFPFNVLDQALNANEPPPQTIPPAVKPQVSLPRRPISFTIRKPES